MGVSSQMGEEYNGCRYFTEFIVVLTYIFQQAPKNKYFTAYCPFNLHISRGHLKVNILQLIVVLTHIFMYLYLMLN